jgi:urease accessory protein
VAEFSGHLSLRAAARENGRTALTTQSFRAPFHLSKPYWDFDTSVLLAQVVNPTAGILAGDKLESEIAVEAGAALFVTTPSASRVFKMNANGVAHCRQTFRVASGAWLEVSPEPLVPHRGSRYRQNTLIEAERGGEVFFCDLLVPGRVGHGEAWEWTELKLETEIRVGGELVLRERFDQSAVDLKALAAWSGSGAAACFGNAVLISEKAGCDNWRAAVERLHGEELWIGVSELRRSGWGIKFVAKNSVTLRQAWRDVRVALAKDFPRLNCAARKL